LHNLLADSCNLDSVH